MKLLLKRSILVLNCYSLSDTYLYLFFSFTVISDVFKFIVFIFGTEHIARNIVECTVWVFLQTTKEKSFIGNWWLASEFEDF